MYHANSWRLEQTCNPLSSNQNEMCRANHCLLSLLIAATHNIKEDKEFCRLVAGKSLSLLALSPINWKDFFLCQLPYYLYSHLFDTFHSISESVKGKFLGGPVCLASWF